MSQATLTPAAKAQLATTIRALRERLLSDSVRLAESEYLLSVPVAQARLPEARRRRRATLEAWLDERQRAARAGSKASAAELREGFLRDAVKEVGATWLNRLVLLKHLEALELSRPKVVTGGWESPGYRRFRQFGPALLSGSETEGYGLLLQLLFEEHAVDLPGLFGEVGLERLFPLPAATLRELVEKLDDKGLESAWTDDTTLGWVYQYWNDPEREALDRKIADGGKIEPGEIASKTQMFTERYMVEWLLQNSLGTTWLAICEKNGWTANAHQVLPGLEARRVAWRAERDAGRVAPDALMPIENELEDRWKYYVQQSLSDDMVKRAPDSIEKVRILEPACGSGHFLLAAFDLLLWMYREEYAFLGKFHTDGEIANSIMQNNLHGIDIDPRAVQIAAAGLFLKARKVSRNTRLTAMNLVAPVTDLANLPANDPSALRFRAALLSECGIPEAATEDLLNALRDSSHLGTLLKIDATVEDTRQRALTYFLGSVQTVLPGVTFSSLGLDSHAEEEAHPAPPPKAPGSSSNVLEVITRFLESHSSIDDLGLRLSGEQFSQGVRFVKMITPSEEEKYDIVVGNPPYQGTAKMADAAYVAKTYKEGKADLYAAFLLRGLELVKPGGCLALLTMRGWMFLGQYAALRKRLLRENDLRLIGDVDRGAFADVPDEVLSVVMTVARRLPPSGISAVAMQPTALSDHSRDSGRTNRKRAALLAQVGRYEFDVRGFGAIEGEPVVYWWGDKLLRTYANAPKLGKVFAVRQGMATTDNARFVRKPWEILQESERNLLGEQIWAPYIKGGAGSAWMDPVSDAVCWRHNGLEVKVCNDLHYGSYSRNIKSESLYFRLGIAFSPIGNAFTARAHRRRGIFGHMGASVFPDSIADVLCLMNGSRSRFVLQSLNPGIHFEVGDVNRLPLFPVESADDIYATLDRAFTEHEAAREASVEFRRPGPSPWRYAQEWAQRSVDRPLGEPLPAYEAAFDPAPPVAFVSYAFGVAMGRFGAGGPSPPGPLSPGRGGGGAGDAGDSDSRALSSPAPLSQGRGAGGEGPRAGGEGPRAAAAGSSHISRVAGLARELGPEMLAITRALRARQTPAEEALWACLRDRSLGAKFRRQHTIDRFVVDFYCHEARLVIELDGSAHAGREDIDAERDRWMHTHGFRVLRYPNTRIDTDLPAVLLDILSALPPPSPRGEGGWGDEGPRGAAPAPASEGILDEAPASALPGGILFLSARADEGAADSLSHPACAPLRAAWDEHGASVGEGDDLRTYLRKSFFAHVKDTYENRPIYFPLSSKQKNFVAWVSIHRFHAGGGATGASALQTLLADHLVPERRAIDAELEELRGARTLGEGKQRAAAEKRYEKMRKLGDELDELLASVARCADKGPPRIDREPEREVDARYAMDLDDGVMVNAAALWPLLEPQWKDPKKWWKELASAQGRKDYDWSHLAARYFPARVAAKCAEDPSLAVAHGCFWRLHPAKAHAWELRLQDEIRPDFTIDEPGSDEARARFLADRAPEAAANKAKEQLRRERKAAKKDDDELPGLGEGDDEKGEPGAEDGGEPN